MSTHTEAHDSSKYYVPHSSHWPIVGSVGLFSLMVGAVSFLNDWAGGWAFLPGALLIATLFIGWFATVIGESERGVFNLDVDRSFRMGMIWFIMSEVLFFAAFFGVLFYARELAVPWLGGEGVKVFNKLLLWKNFNPTWPTNGPGVVGGHADGSFEHHSRLRPAGGEHRHPAVVGRDHHHCPSRAARRPAQHPQDLPGRDLPAGLPVRLPAGHGIPPRLHANWA